MAQNRVTWLIRIHQSKTAADEYGKQIELLRKRRIAYTQHIGQKIGYVLHDPDEPCQFCFNVESSTITHVTED